MRDYIASEQKGELLRLRLEGAEEAGEERGMERGMERGIEKGMEKGEEKKSIEVIRNLFTMAIRKKEEIAKAVNTSLEFVERDLGDSNSRTRPSA